MSNVTDLMQHRMAKQTCDCCGEKGGESRYMLPAITTLMETTTTTQHFRCIDCILAVGRFAIKDGAPACRKCGGPCEKDQHEGSPMEGCCTACLVEDEPLMTADGWQCAYCLEHFTWKEEPYIWTLEGEPECMACAHAAEIESHGVH